MTPKSPPSEQTINRQPHQRAPRAADDDLFPTTPRLHEGGQHERPRYELHVNDAGALTSELLLRAEGQFQLIYLDPPYNTRRSRGSRKHYSDNTRDWSNQMQGILANCRRLLKKEGFLAVSINHMELFNLKGLCDAAFGAECFIGLFPVKIRHSERQLMINATYHDVFEYLLIYRRQRHTRFFTDHKDMVFEKFRYRIELLDDDPQTEVINGKSVEIFSPSQYRIVKAEPHLNHFRRYIIAGKLATANWSGEFFETHLRALGSDLLVRVHGLDSKGLGFRWFHTQTSKRSSGVYFQSTITAGRPHLPTNDLDFTEIVPTVYKEGGPGIDFKDSKKPEQLLEFILAITTKDYDLVGDFFAGSGTTLAQCIKMNRSCITGDNGSEAIRIISKRLSNLRDGKDPSGVRYEFDLQCHL